MPNTVRQLVEKDTDTSVRGPLNIGALFRDVIDLRPRQTDGAGNEVYPEDSNATGFTLAQFIDNYMLFMKEVPFMFIGTPENPDGSINNTHVGLWLDTSAKSNSLWDRRNKLTS